MIGEATKDEKDIRLKKQYEEKQIEYEKDKMIESQLDYEISELQHNFTQLTQDKDFEKYGYVPYERIIEYYKNEKNVNVIAVKAPQGTRVEVTNPIVLECIYENYKKVRIFYNYINYLIHYIL